MVKSYSRRYIISTRKRLQSHRIRQNKNVTSTLQCNIITAKQPMKVGVRALWSRNYKINDNIIQYFKC